ncbi:MAG TPA: hypothetical protein VME47_24030 [Acetobacteraceae bacterium]|nr:hypothetical protein [Acetobacteraceae bacterium]
MSIDYVREKLWAAVDCLVGAEPIRQRLADAAMSLVGLTADDLPTDELKQRYSAVMDALTKHPADYEGEGSIASSTRKLTDEEADKLGYEIYSMYIKVRGGI